MRDNRLAKFSNAATFWQRNAISLPVETKSKSSMAKTIIERMCSITDKMRNPESKHAILVNSTTLKKAETDLRMLRKTLSMNNMQVLILTGVVHRSSRYRIDGDDIAEFMGMEYLQFLTLNSEMEELRRRGYIRTDKEGHINIPQEVLKNLKNNKPIVPEPTTGLTTSAILSRMKKYLEIRDDDEFTDDELFDSIRDMLKDNPDTSISRACEKHIAGIDSDQAIVFFVMIYRYWFEDDDMIGWHNIEDYVEEDTLAHLRNRYRMESLSLQNRGVIEYAGYNGFLDKDYFRIKDEIKDEIFKDMGGVKKREKTVSASRKVESGAIGKKELFYNPAEGRQIAQLQELLSEERLNVIRETMKAKGMRSGFTCLFYGAPGTGKTESVYQIARKSGRDIFMVDVSKIKSCWVGESEKNIKQVFDRYRACVASGDKLPILLFNEADAIFGIRQEGAQDAVDKMENSIQNIILQEMEDMDGILIATTNLTTNLDKAFERRFLYKVRFDKPSFEARERIWKSMLPELSEIEASQLANDFDFSGGQIENIVRKKTVKSLISGSEPSFAEIREFCSEEGIDNAPRRKIGF